MAQTITLDSYQTDVPALTLEFYGWETKSNGREACSVRISDAINTIDLNDYSPSPMIPAGDTKRWADDVLSFIDAGRLEGEPGADDEYYDIEQAHKWWADKYMSPLESDETD